jgi:hypothetical protein
MPELAAVAAADELAQGSLQAAERYLEVAERGQASVPLGDSVGDLGNVGASWWKIGWFAGRLPRVGEVGHSPEVVRCRFVPRSEQKSQSSLRG